MRPPAAAALVFINTTATAFAAFNRRGRQHRTTVESEPTEPEDESTQCGHRQVGAGNGIDLAPACHTCLCVLPVDRTPGKRSGRTSHMHNTGTGKIREPQISRACTYRTPDSPPQVQRPFHRVDQASHDNCEKQGTPTASYVRRPRRKQSTSPLRQTRPGSKSRPMAHKLPVHPHPRNTITNEYPKGTA